MAKIKILTKVVADQIAAGEVVERPASVVKELIENSIDAGATFIQLEIDAGGIGRIRVLDNGTGFAKDEVETAFLRHATSKLSGIDDLTDIKSFGFRGEALASIAAVSKITVNTRSKKDVAGTKLVLKGGELIESRDAGCPEGTDFEVRDLFYNVPARLKFLKREATETSHCIEAVTRMALILPGITFKVISKGRIVKNLIKTDDPQERVKALFKGETLAKIRGGEFGITVTAILGPPEHARAGGGSLYTYVNDRYVRDKSLMGAISRAFGGTLERGRYPVGYVAIEMPGAGVDINVHPQKTEVRFADTQAVFRAVSHVIGAMAAQAPWTKRGDADVNGKSGSEYQTGFENRVKESALDGEISSKGTVNYDNVNNISAPPLPSLSSSFSKPLPSFGNSGRDSKGSGHKMNGVQEVHSAHGVQAVFSKPVPKMLPGTNADFVSRESSDRSGNFSSMLYIGQGRGTFLFLEDGDDLVVMDQHAAHERVTYEKLRAQLSKGGVKSQGLLVSYPVDLGPVEADRIESLKDDLAKLGMEIERAGEDRITIHSVPAELSGVSPDKLLADTVLALEEGRKGTKGDMEDKAVATMACHSSIRAGRRVLKEEVQALLLQMDNIDFAGHCPHGRPVLTRIPWSELAKKVGR